MRQINSHQTSSSMPPCLHASATAVAIAIATATATATATAIAIAKPRCWDRAASLMHCDAAIAEAPQPLTWLGVFQKPDGAQQANGRAMAGMLEIHLARFQDLQTQVRHRIRLR